MRSSQTSTAQTNETRDTPAVDPRGAAFTLIAAGIAAGLPAPSYVQVGRDDDTRQGVALIEFDNDCDSVTRWAAWLNLPAPTFVLDPVHTPARWFRPFESTGRHPDADRLVWVKSNITVDAPATTAGGTK